MDKALPLWASGPGELLQHGIDLLQDDTDAQRRIAMILIDNAVELTLKTYLTLPKRISGVDIPRKKREEYSASFPTLLDGVEAHAADKLVGFNLGEFEWFHRLRNELYHQGNGLTVDRKNVEVFAELAEKMFNALFECDLNIEPPEGSDAQLIGEFFETWISIERNLSDLAPSEKRFPRMRIVQLLHEDGVLSRADLEAYRQVQVIRNELVHGEADPEEMLRPANMAKVVQVAEVLDEIVQRKIDQNLGIGNQ